MAVRSVRNSHYHTTKALEVVRDTGFDNLDCFYCNTSFAKGDPVRKSPR